MRRNRLDFLAVLRTGIPQLMRLPEYSGATMAKKKPKIFYFQLVLNSVYHKDANGNKVSNVIPSRENYVSLNAAIKAANSHVKSLYVDRVNFFRIDNGKYLGHANIGISAETGDFICGVFNHNYEAETES